MKRDRSLAAAFHGGGFHRARRRAAPRAAYLATRFDRASPFPFGPHIGLAISALPEACLLDVERHGLIHSQLLAVIREREIRTTARQIGGGC